jgi:hypothetical protein
MFYKFSKIPNLDSLTYRELQEFKSERNQYLITEKVDGSNISITFNLDNENTSDKNFEVYTRNGNSFKEDILEVLDLDLSKLYAYLSSYFGSIYKSVVLHGELYGSWVMNRLDYGSTCAVCVFYFSFVNEDDTFAFRTTQEETMMILSQAKCSDKIKYIPVFDFITLLDNDNVVDKLKEYCKLPYVSMLSIENQVKNPCKSEGYVVYSIDNDNRLKKMVKIKDEDFRDTIKEAKKDKLDEVTALNQDFNNFFNENRVLDMISKHGGVVSSKDIGNLIKDTILDAKEDFTQQNNEKIEKIQKNLDKQIYKVSANTINMITKIIKNHIKA